ncbi:PREDICTED: platelet glycoprotein Ib alpha chain-like [Branchiostoma belcheri]|uniref:Platelet glycoprotein Ib alpha chain-like n=1 Tax=Branchiostoma belcheri TaxID=7741 RepID=A0A6P4ZV92_BRABE|nr:PREDICTED: platelet glycoprotein Ib alpha chain-like [Branchiostoma belcheri]
MMIAFTVFVLMCALSDAQFFTKLPSPSTTPIPTTVSLPKLPTTTLDATTPWGSTTPREDTTLQGETTPQLQEETTQGVSTTPEESTTIQQEETTPRRVTAGSSTPDAATVTVTAPPGTESTTGYSSPSVQGLQTWEIALIAVGASLGGILIIGGVGYGIYKACGKRKSARVGSQHEMESHEEQRQIESGSRQRLSPSAS